jgi:hypothetical protein
VSSRCLIVVSGLLGQYPLAGVAWDYLQYCIGLARLGHTIYYFENTGQWPYDPAWRGVASRNVGCTFTVRYLADLMARFGLGDRWAYRFVGDGRWYGMDDSARRDVMRTADLLINVSGALQDPTGFGEQTRRAYIDSDPVFTQVRIARGQADVLKHMSAHDVHFSFGESLSADVPCTGQEWRPTRQPIVLDEWAGDEPSRNVFTTVMNWSSYKPVVWNGRSLGQKDVEFERFIDLPAAVRPTVLEVAVNDGKTRRAPRELLAHKGWRVVHPEEACPDLDSYRRYIQSSHAEWSVVKNGYLASPSGWFSCRSACYLAAGRPVVLQDTGFSGVLPVGEGLLCFSDLGEAVSAIRDVEARYSWHRRRARELAEAYFDSAVVLQDLLARCW